MFHIIPFRYVNKRNVNQIVISISLLEETKGSGYTKAITNISASQWAMLQRENRGGAGRLWTPAVASANGIRYVRGTQWLPRVPCFKQTCNTPRMATRACILKDMELTYWLPRNDFGNAKIFTGSPQR